MSHIQAPVNLNNNQITSNVVTDPEIQTTVNLIHSKIVGKVTIDNKQIKTIVTEARDAWQIARDLFVADGGDPEDFMSREDWIESLSSNVDIDTDGALTANSDVKISSQKATKTYVDTFYDTIVVVLNGKLSRSANLGDLANPNIAIAQLGAVPNSRRVNGIALTSDITVNAAAETLTGSAININITDAPGLISVAGGTFGTAAFTDASLFESPLNFSNGIRRIGDQVELYSPEVRGPGGDFGSAAYTESSSYEAPLSFSSGLLRTGNNIEVDQSGITGAVGGEFGSAAYTSVDSLALLNGTNSFTGTSSFNGVLFSTLVEYNSGIVFSYFGDSAANHRAALDVPSISDVTAVQDGINQEILDRGSADSGLAANIYQEINDRIAAINTVADSVGYESDQRVSAIGSLQSALDSEVSRAIAAEAGLQSEINAKIPLVSFTGPVSEIRSFILPDYNATLAISDASQTFYGDQTFGNNVAVNGSLTVGGLSVATLVSPEKTTLTGNGVTTVFAIAGAGSLTNPSALVVAIDGVLQEPIVDYSVGGGNITFTLPVPNGSKAVVVSPTNTIQVSDVIPSDGSVTSAKLATDITVSGTLSVLGTLNVSGNLGVSGVLTAVGQPSLKDSLSTQAATVAMIAEAGWLYNPNPILPRVLYVSTAGWSTNSVTGASATAFPTSIQLRTTSTLGSATMMYAGANNNQTLILLRGGTTATPSGGTFGYADFSKKVLYSFAVNLPAQHTFRAYLGGTVALTAPLPCLGGNGYGMTARWNESAIGLHICYRYTTDNTSITGLSNVSPIVATFFSAHPFSNGDLIEIRGAVGNTAANGIWTVANKTSTTLELSGSTGNGSYSSGADWHRLTPELTTIVENRQNYFDLECNNGYASLFVNGVSVGGVATGLTGIQSPYPMVGLEQTGNTLSTRMSFSDIRLGIW